MTRRAAATVFDPAGAGYSSNNYNATRISTPQQLRDFGRLRRVVAAPVVECPYTHTVPVSGYACIFLLRPYKLTGPNVGFEDRDQPDVYSPEIEYIGTLEDPDTPCRLTGGVGGGGGSTGSVSLVPRLVQ